MSCESFFSKCFVVSSKNLTEVVFMNNSSLTADCVSLVLIPFLASLYVPELKSLPPPILCEEKNRKVFVGGGGSN